MRELHDSPPQNLASGLTGLSERRKDRRAPCSTPAKITMVAPVHAQIGPGTVIEVSKNGLRIRAEKPVFVGSEVIVQMAQALVLGEVRHCRQSLAGGFEFGVRVSDVWDTTSPREAITSPK